MDYTFVIKRPRLTEKGHHAMSEANQYSFDVDLRASKTDIKKAIQDLYKVRVVGVKTQIHKGRRRRTRQGWVMEPKVKTAIIRLHEQDTIELI